MPLVVKSSERQVEGYHGMEINGDGLYINSGLV